MAIPNNMVVKQLKTVLSRRSLRAALNASGAVGSQLGKPKPRTAASDRAVADAAGFRPPISMPQWNRSWHATFCRDCRPPIARCLRAR
jgi:hypothetical protein